VSKKNKVSKRAKNVERMEGRQAAEEHEQAESLSHLHNKRIRADIVAR
jgi:hypothetical protein